MFTQTRKGLMAKIEVMRAVTLKCWVTNVKDFGVRKVSDALVSGGVALQSVEFDAKLGGALYIRFLAKIESGSEIKWRDVARCSKVLSDMGVSSPVVLQANWNPC